MKIVIDTEAKTYTIDGGDPVEVDRLEAQFFTDRKDSGLTRNPPQKDRHYMVVTAEWDGDD